jgi:hypothetical protein
MQKDDALMSITQPLINYTTIITGRAHDLYRARKTLYAPHQDDLILPLRKFN